MRTNVFDELTLQTTTVNQTESNEETYSSIPIDISDIINVCKEYTKLGWQVQNQVETIMEIGVDEAITSGTVNIIAIPHIKDFLYGICKNAYFGDAAEQAYECINMIELFEEEHPSLFKTTAN